MSDRIIDPTRQGITPGDMPDDDVGTIEFGDGWYTLERTLNLMDTWLPEMNWGLHQMCRVLRAELENSREGHAQAADLLDKVIQDRDGLQAELSALKAALPGIIGCDKLDDGYVHVFELASGREPRVSAGCFKHED